VKCDVASPASLQTPIEVAQLQSSGRAQHVFTKARIGGVVTVESRLDVAIDGVVAHVGLATEEPLDLDRALAEVVVPVLELVPFLAPVELPRNFAPEGLWMLDAARVHLLVLIQALAMRVLGELRWRFMQLALLVQAVRHHA